MRILLATASLGLLPAVLLWSADCGAAPPASSTKSQLKSAAQQAADASEQISTILGTKVSDVCMYDPIYGQPVARAKWIPEYSAHIQDESNQYGAPVFVDWSEANLKDSRMDEVCPAWGKLSRAQKIQGITDLIQAMALYESSYRAFIMCLETSLNAVDTVTGRQQTSDGILQNAMGDINWGCPFEKDLTKYYKEHDRLVAHYKETGKTTLEVEDKTLSTVNPYLGFDCTLIKFKRLLQKFPKQSFNEANAKAWRVLHTKLTSIQKTMKNLHSPCFFPGGNGANTPAPKLDEIWSAKDLIGINIERGFTSDRIAKMLNHDRIRNTVNPRKLWTAEDVDAVAISSGFKRSTSTSDEAKRWVSYYIGGQGADPAYLAQGMTQYQVDGHNWTADEVIQVAQRLKLKVRSQTASPSQPQVPNNSAVSNYSHEEQEALKFYFKTHRFFVDDVAEVMTQYQVGKHDWTAAQLKKAAQDLGLKAESRPSRIRVIAATLKLRAGTQLVKIGTVSRGTRLQVVGQAYVKDAKGLEQIWLRVLTPDGRDGYVFYGPQYVQRD